MRSGLPSTASTSFIVHVTLRSMFWDVGVQPAGMLMLIGKSRLSPFAKCVGTESKGFMLNIVAVSSTNFGLMF